MKKIIITITLFVLSVIVKGQWAEYKSTTLNTPTGVSIDAFIFDDENNEDFDEEEVIAQNDDWTEGYNCEILADATKYYNCHGYAWHNIEGNMAQEDLRQIVDRDPYGGHLYIVEKYFTGDDPAYKLLPDPKY